jgi:diadenosine tetraphosphate (Ap4A) HIT family hydrolase
MAMINQPTHATLLKFGYPESCIGETEHWAVMLRPAQLTPGSLIVCNKSDVRAFGALPPEAFLDLGHVTARVEAMLKAVIAYERINWILLMMVDPHVHFHVLPRFSGTRSLAGRDWTDADWPGAPSISAGQPPAPSVREELLVALKTTWNSATLAPYDAFMKSV